jgi:hypothetical protein
MLPVRAFKICALILTMLAAPSWPLGEPVGGLRRDDQADLSPHPQATRTFNEFWTYLFWLNNGIQVELNLSRASFGKFKDPVCGAGLSVMNFKGRDYLVAREYPSGNFVFDTARQRLSVHERIFFEGFPPLKHRVFFSTSKNGVAYFLDLSFEDMLPGLVWGDGVFHLPGDQRLGLYFHIPRARVHGRLGVNGDTVAVEGFGWMDHNWETNYAPRLIDAGYRYALFSGRAEGGCFFQKDGRIFGYGLRQTEGQPVLLRPKGMKTTETMTWAGVAQPRSFEIDYDGAPPTRGRWKDLSQWASAFRQLNSLERFGAKLFAGGDLYSFRGTGVVNDSFPALFSFTAVVGR